MASKSTRSPARSGLIGAAVVFSTLIMLGVGWIEHAGALNSLKALLPNWDSDALGQPEADDGPALSAIDRDTQEMGKRGAIVGVGQFPDAGHVQVGDAMFRFWGVESDPQARVCQNNLHGLACGTDGLGALTTYTHGGLVACFDRGTSVQGERMGQCFHGAIDLGGLLVENGLGFEVPGETPNYHVKQAIAKDHRMGAWANSQ
jgi:hypothetical protein